MQVLKHYIRFIVFLSINLGALGIGAMLMGEGPESDWYKHLAIAPWTPPGWIFGGVWLTIMILFSIYAAKIQQRTTGRYLFSIMFVLQWILNVSWNPLFFMYHLPGTSLFVIICLFLLLILMAMHFSHVAKHYTWLILPYISWLLIAISLNAYVAIFNG